jgi:hypothetical protein
VDDVLIDAPYVITEELIQTLRVRYTTHGPVLRSVLFLTCAQNCVALTESAKEQHSAPTLFDLDPFFFCVCGGCCCEC